ncbi:MAG: Type III restriction-modification system methylation subunit [Parcubacteria group bacterium GW2011_GWC2_42_12]|nr:MAG: Type III restriction-modification system methylation subunit [Parcubacteria group bacterium GW2011_GWC2_42_12]
MKSTKRTPEENEKAQLENEIARLNKKIAKYEAIELKQNRFGLVWLDVPEAFEDDVENKLPILEEVPKQAIYSKDGKPTHLLIEGDNYHALTCLNYTHKGKVDVIYIDPPYNTGSDGFKYKDKRILEEYPDGTEVPVEHPLRHSYWLSFMKKRLDLARDILAKTGLIFISIDDNELAQLKLLCDEIFNESNFISLNVIESGEVFGTKAGHADKTFVKVKDYVLVYAKNKSEVKNKQPLYDNMRELYDSHFNTIIKDDLSRISLVDFLNDEKWVKELFSKNKLKINARSINFMMNFNEKFKDFMYVSVAEKLFTDQPFAKKIDQNFLKKQPTGKPFRFEDRLLFKTTTGSVRMFIKFKEGIKNSDDFESAFTRCTLRGDLWKGFHLDMRNIQDEGNIDFKNGKKPVRLVKQILKWNNNKYATILDFFAGSGTTGHAVMELNKEDDGERQFIIITNNEEVINGQNHKIMTDICYPRIKNVIKGYNSKKGLGNSVRYFKTAFVGKNNILKADDADKIDLAHNAGGMLAIAENTFDLVEQNNFWQIFESPKQFTAIYFREEFGKFDNFVEKIRKLKKPTVVYIFSWEKEFDFNDFDDDKNIKIKTIPQPILEIYKNIYNLV